MDYASTDLEQFIIFPLIEETFDSWPYWCIDFTIHKKINVSYEKNVTMLPNGRPSVAVYTYIKSEYPDITGKEVARITWEFEDSPTTGLFSSRKEFVSFKRKPDAFTDPANEWSDPFMIKETILNPTRAYDQIKAMEEREKGRKNVISEVKLIVFGFLMQAKLMSRVDALFQSAIFFDLHSENINLFIETGSDNILSGLSSDTSTSWLDDIAGVLPDSTPLTLRMLILSKLDY